MQRLLIIEDEVKTARSIKQGLEEHHYDVELAYDGDVGAKMAMRGNYDLIVSDIILPGLNGIEICKQLRAAQIQTPVLMLTALGTVADKVEGFDSGADDYLSKPFEFQELLVRIRALLKRNPQIVQPHRVLTIADLTLNLDTKKADRSGTEIELTAKEFALLEYFILHKNRVLSKVEIAEHVWGIDFDTGTNVIEVYVNYLRKKIDKNFSPKLIHTQFGMGYIMKEK
jgi:two-component system copper resistance phosphate regulon response regulator CusR